jgi:putative aldouronate transport system permease protein
MTKGEKIFQVFNYLILFLLVVATLYPFIYVIFASFSDPWQFAGHQGILLKPLGFSLASYKAVINNRSIATGYLSTLFNLVFGTSINIFLTLLGAYALSRTTFLFKNALTVFITFTMFFSGGMIPLFLQVRSLGLYDSRFSMILPTAISVWNMIIMRTSIQTLPSSLEESAFIDGANDFHVLFFIVTPLIRSTIAVIILFYGVAHWNQWYQALLFVQTRDRFPLQMILREILISNSTDSMLIQSDGMKEPIQETIKYATIMVSTLPILSIYPMLQKHFVKGMMVGAIKG